MDKNNLETRELHLTKTRLYVNQYNLIREDDKGNLIGKFKLNDIQKINVSKVIDINGPVISGISIALFLVSFNYYLIPILNWITLIVAIGLFGIGILVWKKTVIKFQVENDSIVYDTEEDYDIVKGFVISLKQKINSIKKEKKDANIS